MATEEKRGQTPAPDALADEPRSGSVRERIGFIGLGLMGRPMARRLLGAGYELQAYSRTIAKAEGLSCDGAKVCSSPAEAARQADILILMVTDADAVEAVLFGPGGACEALTSGSLVIDMSSTHPGRERVFAQRLLRKGVDLVDAPVSGGVVGAEQGTLTIMVGGSSKDLSRAAPVLKVLGREVTHVGSVGNGQLCKVANQMIVGATLASVAEALVLAAKGGASPAAVRRALLSGFANSRILELHGDRMLQRSFEAGGKSELQNKDLKVALQTARELGVSAPLTAAVQGLYEVLIGDGGGRLDHSAIVQVFEERAGCRLDHDERETAVVRDVRGERREDSDL